MLFIYRNMIQTSIYYFIIKFLGFEFIFKKKNIKQRIDTLYRYFKEVF